ncbi:F510_1955 family glycosylhydrolase [Planococcus sp. ISL-110]|uniref:F510_1955 family glycosylhydrolase n=1 Tax=Planococcus sp. ISL-110 TaxID=2819167 RepID=UPI001BE5ADC1|nr:hypothetical protein [Planococcus sp. ISL-110]MBT2571591.1 hypothetical protein [Planococcus sp. ISL-110]
MKKRIMVNALLSMTLLAGCSNNTTGSFEVPFKGELSHVHGMGYPGNGDSLYFASHIGLKIYRDSEWYETADNFYDYMGFNAVGKGFYSSGHPSADSNLPNPLGIQRSADGGETLEEVAFQGETDFHAMAVGYTSHEIFLFNPTKNSLLAAGFHKSNDEGESWEPAQASGLKGEVSALALHPTDSNLVAAATSSGVYFSRDAGETFEVVTAETETGTAVHFTEDHLYFGSFGTTAALMKYTVENEELEMLNIPDLSEDAIAFIAQNPNDELELAIYTLQGQAYLSEDGSQTWETLLQDGEND